MTDDPIERVRGWVDRMAAKAHGVPGAEWPEQTPNEILSDVDLLAERLGKLEAVAEAAKAWASSLDSDSADEHNFHVERLELALAALSSTDSPEP